MRATLRLPRSATYADYLAVEEHSEHRHELIDGVIVAMAGGSDEHNALAGRLAMLAGMRLAGECRYYSPDQRFWIAGSERNRYADGSVIFGRPEHPVHDDQATTNPRFVFEVLSPSSEGDDDGDKRLDFQSLSTVQAYVLIDQDRRRVRVYRRDSSDQWRASPETFAEGQRLALPGLSADLGVDDLYENILDAEGRSLLR
ncbi:MAG: Uma2 family endonuclease [Polyangiaceae bacterium]